MIKDKVSERKVRRLRAKRAIRKKVFGCAEKPRLVIFKSRCYIYAQAIDDHAGHTMAAASSREEGFTAEGNPQNVMPKGWRDYWGETPGGIKSRLRQEWLPLSREVKSPGRRRSRKGFAILGGDHGPL